MEKFIHNGTYFELGHCIHTGVTFCDVTQEGGEHYIQYAIEVTFKDNVSNVLVSAFGSHGNEVQICALNKFGDKILIHDHFLHNAFGLPLTNVQYALVGRTLDDLLNELFPHVFDWTNVDHMRELLNYMNQNIHLYTDCGAGHQEEELAEVFYQSNDTTQSMFDEIEAFQLAKAVDEYTMYDSDCDVREEWNGIDMSDLNGRIGDWWKTSQECDIWGDRECVHLCCTNFDYVNVCNEYGTMSGHKSAN